MFLHKSVFIILVVGATAFFGQIANAKQPGRGRWFGENLRIASRDGLRTMEQRDNPRAPIKGTNLRAFGIPFTVQNTGDRYIEVQLYASRDQGQSWNFHSRQPPTASEFRFENHADGEYWFAIRTLDRDRQLHPAGAMLPELKVIVDTVQPELDFRIQNDPAGRIVVRWRGADANIDATTTRIAFRPLISADDGQNQWLSVPYKPVANVVDGVFADQYAWWPEPRSREVLVQLAISDVAGNVAIEERQVVLPEISAAPGQMALANPGTRPSANIDFNGITSGTAGNNQSMFEVSSTTRSPGPDDPVTTAKPAAAETGLIEHPNQPLMYGMMPVPKPPAGLTGNPADGSTQADIVWSGKVEGGSGLQPTVQTGRPTYPDNRPMLSGNDGSNAATPNNSVVENSAVPFLAPQNANAGDKLAGPPPQSALGQIPVGDHATSARNASAMMSPTTSAGSNSVLSPENDVRYMSTRRFRLDYSLDSLVPNSISKVVLWATSDQGKSWTAWAEDTDNESPFPVEMENPGLYGYRIVFHTADGLAGPAPASGDSADVWIKIDLDHPDARLIGAPYGTGNQAGRLLIQWEASDELLRNRPVRLSFAIDRMGPWTIIEDGLDNTGEFAWKPTSSVPERVHLRLDVTDAAGNVSTSATDQAIDLRGLIPRGRILDVTPVK